MRRSAALTPPPFLTGRLLLWCWGVRRLRLRRLPGRPETGLGRDPRAERKILDRALEFQPAFFRTPTHATVVLVSPARRSWGAPPNASTSRQMEMMLLESACASCGARHASHSCRRATHAVGSLIWLAATSGWWQWGDRRRRGAKRRSWHARSDATARACRARECGVSHSCRRATHAVGQPPLI